MAKTNHEKVLNRARMLHRSQRYDEALVAYHRYLGLQSNHAAAWADCGDLLLIMGRLDQACEACDRAIALDSKNLQARLALAEAMVKKMDLDRAMVVLAEALKQNPNNYSVLEALCLIPGNRLDLHREMKRYLEAGPSAEKIWNLACRNLLLGHMHLGWAQYESRWDVPNAQGRPKELMLAQPQWNGEPFAGKTLLIRWEQGLGDVIMFVRYAPLVKARGGRVLLEVFGPLADLVATCYGIDEVIKHGDSIPSFDLQVPLLSLPRIFQTDLGTIPADIPYLSIPNLVPHREGINRILAATSGHTRIGLVWAGNPKHTRDAERSISPVLLKPLEPLPVAWHSFQIEREREQPFSRIIPMGSIISSSFSDSAYAISAMNLIITVDTSIAHLAGALGIPTFLLIPAFPDWRWLMGRDDSPWYPTMRIYRQPEPGDWTSVIARVVSDLSSCG
jgi:Tetratricopeptide repeat